MKKLIYITFTLISLFFSINALATESTGPFKAGDHIKVVREDEFPMLIGQYGIIQDNGDPNNLYLVNLETAKGLYLKSYYMEKVD